MFSQIEFRNKEIIINNNNMTINTVPQHGNKH